MSTERATGARVIWEGAIDGSEGPREGVTNGGSLGTVKVEREKRTWVGKDELKSCGTRSVAKCYGRV